MKKILFLLPVMAIITTTWIYKVTIQDAYYAWKYPPQKTYFKTLKSGKWVMTEDSTKAEYYRLISFDENDQPIGIVRDYYINGHFCS